MGAFTYSKEENTVADKMDNQVDEKVKKARLNRLMRVQQKISYDLNKKRIGEVMEGLVVAKNLKNGEYEFRSGWNAPDDVDGKIIITSDEPLKIGQKVTVKITNAFSYDLYGIKLN